MPLYPPQDLFPYPRDPKARIASAKLADGLFAYAQDSNGTVFVLPDGPHVHPQILGQATPALYAGDLTVQDGEIVDVTNLSGTFQCDDPGGLIAAADQLLRQGLFVRPGAVRFFPADGSPPVVLK